MRTLELSSSKTFGCYSAGEQYKCWVNINNVAYLVKVNTHCREASKEVSAYRLAKSFGIPCVEYKEIAVKLSGVDRKACICKSYLGENEKFNRVVECLSVKLKLDKLSLENYIKTIMTFDYIICNTDRHLNNISFIENNGVYRFAPIYDNGKSFLSTDAVLTDSNLIARSNKYKSKPFSSNPKSNLIGIEFSKYLVKQWLSNAGNLDNVLTNKGHLKIVKYRINKLLSL